MMSTPKQTFRSTAEISAIHALLHEMLADYVDHSITPPLTHRDMHFESHRLYSARDFDTAWARRELLSDDGCTKLERYLKAISASGAFRRLIPACHLDALKPLRERFPHFTPVLDAIAKYLAIAKLSGKSPLRLPPILLGGDPGVGKTHFARQLAATLGTSFTEVAFGSASSGFILSGLDLGWSTGQAGMVFNTLVLGSFGNPLVLLDEIDKASTRQDFNVLGPLYGLLEPGTAMTFTDEAVQLPLDASQILWVGTANELSLVPDPILSRFAVFTVPAPTYDQGRQIAAQVYEDLRVQYAWDDRFASALDHDTVDAVADMAPRRMKKALLAAAGAAALAGRTSINVDDIERDSRRVMGFF